MPGLGVEAELVLVIETFLPLSMIAPAIGTPCRPRDMPAIAKAGAEFGKPADHRVGFRGCRGA